MKLKLEKKRFALSVKRIIPAFALSGLLCFGVGATVCLAEEAAPVENVENTDIAENPENAEIPLSPENTEAPASQESGMTGTILPNVYVGNVNVGGMTIDDARNACVSYVDSVNASVINLNCAGETIQVSLSELGIGADVNSVVEAAYKYGRTGNVLKRYKEKKSLENGEPKNLELHLGLGENAYASMEAALSGFNREATPAGISMVDGVFEIQPETVGVAVDIQATYDALQLALNNSTDFSNINVDVVANEQQPEVTSDELNGITDKLGEYTTSYGGGDAGRMANVENACSFINGTLVLPGEEFDTDATIRPYTEENGYHYAGEYSNGTVVQGLGGGVCQVSTTLYNAVLFAELEVTERYAHSLTVGYVQLSQDAAISGTVKNFKFRNNTDTPIYIAGACEDGKITFAIFGKETRPENRTLEFESVLIETISPGEPEVTVDESLPAGSRTVTQKAHTGYVAELWKHVYVDGQLTDSVKVNSSQYMSTPEKVTVGPDEPGEEAPPEGNTEAVPPDANTEAAPTEAPVPEGAPEDPPAE